MFFFVCDKNNDPKIKCKCDTWKGSFVHREWEKCINFFSSQEIAKVCAKTQAYVESQAQVLLISFAREKHTPTYVFQVLALSDCCVLWQKRIAKRNGLSATKILMCCENCEHVSSSITIKTSNGCKNFKSGYSLSTISGRASPKMEVEEKSRTTNVLRTECVITYKPVK